MTYDRDAVREMIPLYINGRLSPDETREVEEALERDPALRAELSEFIEIRDSLRDLADDIPGPPGGLFASIEERMRAEDGRRYSGGFMRVARELLFSPRVAWGLVAVQCLLLIFLIVRPPRQSFTTLSAVEGGVRFNVVFKEDATEKVVRRLLNDLGASIVSGPSPEGRYIISVDVGGAAAEEVTKRLRESGVVKFAEKAY